MGVAAKHTLFNRNWFYGDQHGAPVLPPVLVEKQIGGAIHWTVDPSTGEDRIASWDSFDDGFTLAQNNVNLRLLAGWKDGIAEAVMRNLGEYASGALAAAFSTADTTIHVVGVVDNTKGFVIPISGLHLGTPGDDYKVLRFSWNGTHLECQYGDGSTTEVLAGAVPGGEDPTAPNIWTFTVEGGTRKFYFARTLIASKTTDLSASASHRVVGDA